MPENQDVPHSDSGRSPARDEVRNRLRQGAIEALARGEWREADELAMDLEGIDDEFAGRVRGVVDRAEDLRASRRRQRIGRRIGIYAAIAVVALLTYTVGSCRTRARLERKTWTALSGAITEDDQARSRALARIYITHFPDGAHAEEANGIVDGASLPEQIGPDRGKDVGAADGSRSGETDQPPSDTREKARNGTQDAQKGRDKTEGAGNGTHQGKNNDWEKLGETDPPPKKPHRETQPGRYLVARLDNVSLVHGLPYDGSPLKLAAPGLSPRWQVKEITLWDQETEYSVRLEHGDEVAKIRERNLATGNDMVVAEVRCGRDQLEVSRVGGARTPLIRKSLGHIAWIKVTHDSSDKESFLFPGGGDPVAVELSERDLNKKPQKDDEKTDQMNARRELTGKVPAPPKMGEMLSHIGAEWPAVIKDSGRYPARVKVTGHERRFDISLVYQYQKPDKVAEAETALAEVEKSLENLRRRAKAAGQFEAKFKGMIADVKDCDTFWRRYGSKKKFERARGLSVEDLIAQCNKAGKEALKFINKLDEFEVPKQRVKIDKTPFTRAQVQNEIRRNLGEFARHWRPLRERWPDRKHELTQRLQKLKAERRELDQKSGSGQELRARIRKKEEQLRKLRSEELEKRGKGFGDFFSDPLELKAEGQVIARFDLNRVDDY